MIITTDKSTLEPVYFDEKQEPAPPIEQILQTKSADTFYGDLLCDRLKALFIERGIMDEEGNFNAQFLKEELPPLDKEASARVKNLLASSQNLVFKDLSRSTLIPLLFLPSIVKKHLQRSYRDPTTSLEFVGGIVPSLLGEPFYISALKKLGISDPELFIDNETKTSLSVFPPDIDLRIHCNELTSPDLEQIQAEVIKQLALLTLGAATQKNRDEVIQKAFLNKKHVKDANILIISFSNRSSGTASRAIDQLVFSKLKRPHLFSRDALTILCIKNRSGKWIKPTGSWLNGWPAIISRLTKTISIKEPESINQFGWVMLISYISREYCCLNSKSEEIVRHTFTQHLSQQGDRLAAYAFMVNKTISNHHYGDFLSACCLHFNASQQIYFNTNEWKRAVQLSAAYCSALNSPLASEVKHSAWTQLFLELMQHKDIPFALIQACLVLAGSQHFGLPFDNQREVEYVLRNHVGKVHLQVRIRNLGKLHTLLMPYSHGEAQAILCNFCMNMEKQAEESQRLLRRFWHLLHQDMRYQKGATARYHCLGYGDFTFTVNQDFVPVENPLLLTNHIQQKLLQFILTGKLTSLNFLYRLIPEYFSRDDDSSEMKEALHQQILSALKANYCENFCLFENMLKENTQSIKVIWLQTLTSLRDKFLLKRVIKWAMQELKILSPAEHYAVFAHAVAIPTYRGHCCMVQWLAFLWDNSILSVDQLPPLLQKILPVKIRPDLENDLQFFEEIIPLCKRLFSHKEKRQKGIKACWTNHVHEFALPLVKSLLDRQLHNYALEILVALPTDYALSDPSAKSDAYYVAFNELIHFLTTTENTLMTSCLPLYSTLFSLIKAAQHPKIASLKFFKHALTHNLESIVNYAKEEILNLLPHVLECMQRSVQEITQESIPAESPSSLMEQYVTNFKFFCTFLLENNQAHLTTPFLVDNEVKSLLPPLLIESTHSSVLLALFKEAAQNEDLISIKNAIDYYCNYWKILPQLQFLDQVIDFSILYLIKYRKHELFTTSMRSLIAAIYQEQIAEQLSVGNLISMTFGPKGNLPKKNTAKLIPLDKEKTAYKCAIAIVNKLVKTHSNDSHAIYLQMTISYLIISQLLINRRTCDTDLLKCLQNFHFSPLPLNDLALHDRHKMQCIHLSNLTAKTGLLDSYDLAIKLSMNMLLHSPLDIKQLFLRDKIDFFKPKMLEHIQRMAAQNSFTSLTIAFTYFYQVFPYLYEHAIDYQLKVFCALFESLKINPLEDYPTSSASDTISQEAMLADNRAEEQKTVSSLAAGILPVKINKAGLYNSKERIAKTNLDALNSSDIFNDLYGDVIPMKKNGTFEVPAQKKIAYVLWMLELNSFTNKSQETTKINKDATVYIMFAKVLSDITTKELTVENYIHFESYQQQISHFLPRFLEATLLKEKYLAECLHAVNSFSLASLKLFAIKENEEVLNRAYCLIQTYANSPQAKMAPLLLSKWIDNIAMTRNEKLLRYGQKIVATASLEMKLKQNSPGLLDKMYQALK